MVDKDVADRPVIDVVERIDDDQYLLDLPFTATTRSSINLFADEQVEFNPAFALGAEPKLGLPASTSATHS